jgi:predicted nucleic acid-binding protein
MTSWVVLDSGVLLAAVLPEQYSVQAKRLLERLSAQATRLAAPLLFRYEVVAVLRKYVHRRALTLEEAAQHLDLLLTQPVETIVDDALLRRGYELATQLSRPSAYDSQYLAVAERLNCPFWTADERLYNAVQSRISWVKWLGNPADTPEDAEGVGS